MTIEELQEQVNCLTAQISEGRTQSAAKDAALTSANEKLATLQESVNKSADPDLQKQITELTTKLATSDQKNADRDRADADAAILKDFPAIKDATLLVGNSPEERRLYADKLTKNFAPPPQTEEEKAAAVAAAKQVEDAAKSGVKTTFSSIPPAGSTHLDPGAAGKKAEAAESVAKAANAGDGAGVLAAIMAGSKPA